jgi:hypothetical protein
LVAGGGAVAVKTGLWKTIVTAAIAVWRFIAAGLAALIAYAIRLQLPTLS